MSSFNVYKSAIASAIAEGNHRTIVGGLWDEIGALQINYLKQEGLRPDHHLLDIGAGSLRLGVLAVDYLDQGHYWATDLFPELLDAGYTREIVPAGLADKLPRSNLSPDDEFQFRGVPHSIDFAMASSVFTHLPLNDLRLCLANLAAHVEGHCNFYFTIFTPPEGRPVVGSYEQKDGVVTHSHRDPFHYQIDDVRYAAKDLPWQIDYIGDWNHPRNQMMVRATKRR